MFVQEEGRELQLGGGPDLPVRGEDDALLHVGPDGPDLQDWGSAPPARGEETRAGVTNIGPDPPPPLHAGPEESGAESQVEMLSLLD